MAFRGASKLSVQQFLTYVTPVLVIAAVVILGRVVIFTHAATPTASVEAESGTLGSSAFVTDDSLASGNKAVSFTEGTPTPIAHATLPPGPYHFAQPTITLDYSAAPQFGPWMEQVLKPLLEQWYPVLEDYYAYPDYVPINNFTVKADPTYNGAALTSNNVITFSTAFFTGGLAAAPGAFMHEATHVIQLNNPNSGINLPGWIMEGEADYTREHIYNDRAPRAPFATETFLNGYSPSADLLDYIQTHYDPTFVHEVNVAGHLDNYNANIFVQKTGKTVAQLWTELTGQPISNPGPTTGILGKCIDDPNFSTVPNTRLKVQTCNGSSAELWAWAGVNGSATVRTLTGPGAGDCLDIQAGVTTNGTPAVLYACNGAVSQQWSAGANGSLVNVKSNTCLQTVGSASADGTLLEIDPCNGSTAQQWVLPT